MLRALGVLVLAGASIGASPAAMGGWAVITVRDVPERLTPGVATPIHFTMLQHGERLLTGRTPTVSVRGAGTSRLSSWRGVKAHETEPGVYTATIVAPDTGWAEIEIDGNWHRARVTLLPVRVTRGSGQVALSAYDRGRQLFVAKGCVTCHAMKDDQGIDRTEYVAAGPELTGRQFEAGWLRQKLADPARDRVRFTGGVTMPDLRLTPAEIAALTSYINGTATRTATAAR
jgi:mono/diheme cytochrome c family protein